MKTIHNPCPYGIDECPTCTPIESPEEKCECKATCEEEKGGWEERFEDKFLNVLTWIKISNPNEIISGVDINHLPNELKSFLRSELATAREEGIRADIEMLREMEEELNPLFPPGSEVNLRKYLHNQTIEEVINRKKGQLLTPPSKLIK